MTGPTLTAPFKNTQELEKGGRKFTYVPTPEVIDRLNTCLGYGAWSYEVVEAFHYPADDPRYVVAKGRLTAMGAVYEQYGGQAPNRNKQGVILDLADDYKGAASDAMKKCAAFIGVGLYLSLKRQPIPNDSQSPATNPAGAPPESLESDRMQEANPPAAIPPPADAAQTGKPASAGGATTDSLEKLQADNIAARVNALSNEQRALWIRDKPKPGPTFTAEALAILDLIEQGMVTA